MTGGHRARARATPLTSSHRYRPGVVRHLHHRPHVDDEPGGQRVAAVEETIQLDCTAMSRCDRHGIGTGLRLRVDHGHDRDRRGHHQDRQLHRPWDPATTIVRSCRCAGACLGLGTPSDARRGATCGWTPRTGHLVKHHAPRSRTPVEPAVLEAELPLSWAGYGQAIHRLADAEQAAALAIRARNARGSRLRGRRRANTVVPLAGASASALPRSDRCYSPWPVRQVRDRERSPRVLPRTPPLPATYLTRSCRWTVTLSPASFPIAFADIGLHWQHVSAVAHGHEGTSKRVAVNGPADLDQPSSSEELNGIGHHDVRPAALARTLRQGRREQLVHLGFLTHDHPSVRPIDTCSTASLIGPPSAANLIGQVRAGMWIAAG